MSSLIKRSPTSWLDHQLIDNLISGSDWGHLKQITSHLSSGHLSALIICQRNSMLGPQQIYHQQSCEHTACYNFLLFVHVATLSLNLMSFLHNQISILSYTDIMLFSVRTLSHYTILYNLAILLWLFYSNQLYIWFN